MRFASKIFAGWQGAVLVAVTYLHFLIFAQFAFLGRLAAWQLNPLALKLTMGSMAIGGVCCSLLVPRLQPLLGSRRLLRLGLLLCAASAFLSLLQLRLAAAIPAGFLVGAGAAILTVTLATHVRDWCGESFLLPKVAIGTGVGYLICNLPYVFRASSSTQALGSGLLCLAALAIPLKSAVTCAESIDQHPIQISRSSALLFFFVLIWLDSAAFYIIQHSQTLKSGTWQGTSHLVAIGLLHCVAAIFCGLVLNRKSFYAILCAAFFFLAVACLLLHSSFLLTTASIFYPVGVSLYSVALVAYPSLLSGASSVRDRSRIAARIYAIAGWIGSALGIGMAEHMGQVPIAFLLFAGCVLLTPALRSFLLVRGREVAAIALLLLVALLLKSSLPTQQAIAPADSIQRGRQVYIAEGCIHCHSQYVRPDSRDRLLWGPALPTALIHSQRPPLIGNRRQGPDLSQVGSRRSSLWLRMHFIDPPEVSGASIMPSFAVLFRDQRGEDLVAYLSSLKTADSALAAERLDWQPSMQAEGAANLQRGEALYGQFCATCHNANGQTRQRGKTFFSRQPPNLLLDPLLHVSQTDSSIVLRKQLAQMIRFGLPGSDMPGHEYLNEQEIASLAYWIAHQRTATLHNPTSR